MPYGKGTYGHKVGRPAELKLVRKHETGTTKKKPTKIQIMSKVATVKKMKSITK